MVKHCLDCDSLTEQTRCIPCRRRHERALSASGRARRGAKWDKVSSAIRLYWREQGRQCVDAADGQCRGTIQTDHIRPGSSAFGYAPRCSYHNAKKGNRNGTY